MILQVFSEKLANMFNPGLCTKFDRMGNRIGAQWKASLTLG